MNVLGVPLHSKIQPRGQRELTNLKNLKRSSMKNNLRQRASKRFLKVTFPNGEVINHENVTTTFVETLARIGSDNFDKISLKLCYLPLLSKEIYPKYKEWMKPVCDGWYVNTQSVTDQKYIQLRSINTKLGLDLKIELVTDFITSDEKPVQKQKKGSYKLWVKFPDGESICEDKPVNTLLKCIEKIGVDKLQRKEIEYRENPIITYTKLSNEQVPVEDRWLIAPSQTKDKLMMLRRISSTMRLNLETRMI